MRGDVRYVPRELQGLLRPWLFRPRNTRRPASSPAGARCSRPFGCLARLRTALLLWPVGSPRSYRTASMAAGPRRKNFGGSNRILPLFQCKEGCNEAVLARATSLDYSVPGQGAMGLGRSPGERDATSETVSPGPNAGLGRQRWFPKTGACMDHGRQDCHPRTLMRRFTTVKAKNQARSWREPKEAPRAEVSRLPSAQEISRHSL